MKFLLVVLFSLMSFSCSKTVASNFITKGCVASICVGMDEFVVKSHSSGEVYNASVNREGDNYPALKVMFDDKNSILLEMENDSVWAIRIESAHFITPHGVGVGSSYLEVKESYPDAVLNYGEEDGGYVSLFVKHLNGFFSFDIEDLPLSSLTGEASIDERKFTKLKAKVVLIHNMGL